jgi:protein MpaA
MTNQIIISAVLLSACAIGQNSSAETKVFNEIFNSGYVDIPVVSEKNVDDYKLSATEAAQSIKKLCADLKNLYKLFEWKDDACNKTVWQADFKSKGNRPLIYATFGTGNEVTLILGGVHPDEVNPIPLSFRFATYLTEHPEVYKNTDVKIIIAPLVNPDGFVSTRPSRSNSNGVDLNRNFFTLDWYKTAKQKWQQTHRPRDPRLFPGYFPNSEIETLFQISLIDESKPDKIVSLHAPLKFLDYDGPGDRKRQLTAVEKQAKQLVHEIASKARNYQVVDYHFFPGSLGNYAGNERLIPTVTLELETTDPKKTDSYWQHFLPGLLQAIKYRVKVVQNPKPGARPL